jgi:GH15 family glucan-1,4-alpha-glucosidase
MSSLDLALIGNCSYGALVNAVGEVVWVCMPRFDSDPVFCSLLRARDRPDDFGFYAIDLLDVAGAEQYYLVNTAVLVTRRYDALGRREEARALFEILLACRDRHGLLSEGIDPNTRELWGNFAQTYSMVGLINSAMRLSKPWEEAF